ncbi:MAG: GNAT family protein [Candidatus Acidiferrales bacterium]|jgi:RimJ/RimL family protein N-acetyltransferase
MKVEFMPLQGRFVRLEPVTPAIKELLRAAVECDPDTWSTMIINPLTQGFDPYWSSMLEGIASGHRLAYAVRRLSDDSVIGTSSFMGLSLSQRGIEIGATFLHPGARGGFANPECKLLMLEHAFNAGAVRVEFVIDSENWRSQSAVLKLGAVREGVLRSRKIAWNGDVRDVVFFSVIDQDWPAVRASLMERLTAYRTPA